MKTCFLAVREQSDYYTERYLVYRNDQWVCEYIDPPDFLVGADSIDELKERWEDVGVPYLGVITAEEERLLIDECKDPKLFFVVPKNWSGLP